MRNELDSLHELSNTTTRQLDASYYSVLEKLSALQNTVVSLKEVATMSQSLTEDLRRESASVVTEVESQLASLGDFDAPHQRIRELAQRIQNGRRQIQSLHQRVEHVRDKVRYWDEAELHWQENARKRLQKMWMCITVLSVSLALLVGIFYYRAWGGGGGSENIVYPARDMIRMRVEGELPLEDMEIEMEKALNWSWRHEDAIEDGHDDRQAAGIHHTAKKATRMEEPEDARLRMLDEL